MPTTTDAALRSFVPVATESHFPIQNLPYGVIRRRGVSSPRLGVAIGVLVLDLFVLDEAGLLPRLGQLVFRATTLNPFMALGPSAWRQTRETLTRLLRADEPDCPRQRSRLLRTCVRADAR